MSDPAFDSYILKLKRLAEVRGVSSTKVAVIERVMNNEKFIIVLSTFEPSLTTLPFNVVWVNVDKNSSSNYGKVFRRFGKKPLSSMPYFKHAWAELTTLSAMFEESPFYDIYDMTLMGDFVVDPNISFLPATTNTIGLFKLSVPADIEEHPRVVGEGDLRLTNSRPPVAHDHPEFSDLPGLQIKNTYKNINLETVNAPNEGDVLFIGNTIRPDIHNPSSQTIDGLWRPVAVSDVDGYESPIKSIMFLGADAIKTNITEHTRVTYTFEGTTYSGVKKDVTDSVTLSVFGVSEATISRNSIDFGEVADDTQATLTALYVDPISGESITKTKTLVITNIPVPEDLLLFGPDSIDELTTGEFSAKARYTDGTVRDVEAVFSVSNPAYGSFLGGVFQANEVSASSADRLVSCNVLASYTDADMKYPVTVSATKSLTIKDLTPILPASLSIIGSSSAIEGAVVEYVARLYYNNGTFDDLPKENFTQGTLSWIVSDSDLLSLGGDDGNIVTFARVLNDVTGLKLSARYDYTVSGQPFHLLAEKALGISANNIVESFIVQGPDTLDENTSDVFAAKIVYDDGFEVDVSSNCTWSIVYPDVSITQQTKDVLEFDVNALTLSCGEIHQSVPVTIRANYVLDGQLLSNGKTVVLTDVTPYPASINIVGADEINEQTNSWYVAEITYTSGEVANRVATWTSSNNTTAAFSGEMLMASDVTEDKSVTITATYTENGVTASATKDVAIKFVPPIVLSASLDTETSQSRIEEETIAQLVLIQNWSDGIVTRDTLFPDYTLSSSNAAVLAVDPTNGALTAGNVGADTEVTITATPSDGGDAITLQLEVYETPPVLVGIDFDSVVTSVLEQTQKSLTVVGTYDDNGVASTAAISASACTWTADNAAVLDTTGALAVVTFARTDVPVDVTVTATVGEFTATKVFSVSPAVLQNVLLTVENQASLIPEGQTVPYLLEESSYDLVLEGTYSNGVVRRLEEEADVAWVSTNLTVATVAVNGIVNTLNVLSDTPVTFIATYKGKSSSVSAMVEYVVPVLTSIAVTISGTEVNEGETLTVTGAIGNYSDGTNQDLLSSVTYSVNPAELGSWAGAVFTAASVETDTPAILLVSHDGHDEEIAITVKDVPTVTAVHLLGSGASIFEGQTTSLTLMAEYSNGVLQDATALATWTSSDDTRATVASGVVTAQDISTSGSVTITATLDSFTKEALVSVFVISPVVSYIVGSDEDMFEGDAGRQLVLGVDYTDGSHGDSTATATWTSSDDLIATVVAGLVTPAADVTGDQTVTITSDIGDGFTNSISILVRDIVPTSVWFTGEVAELFEDNQTTQLECVVKYTNDAELNKTADAVWTSSDPAATVVAGLVTAQAVTTDTTVTISATVDGVTHTTDVVIRDIHPTQVVISGNLPEIFEGGVVNLTATATYTNGDVVDETATAVWTTSDPLVATVVNGVVTFEQVPNDTPVDITADVAGVTHTVTIDTLDIHISAINISAPTGAGLNLLEGETATIEVGSTYNDGATSTVDVADLTFTSSDPTALTVDAAGLVTAQSVPADTTVMISADLTADPSISDTVSFNVIKIVVDALNVTAPASVDEQTTTPIAIEGHYNDGSTADLSDGTDLTFATNNPAAYLSVEGGVVSIVSGNVGVDTEVELTVTHNGVVSQSFDVNVVYIPHLAQLTVLSPLAPQNEIHETGRVQLLLVGTYSDDTKVDLTSQAGVSWVSSDPAYATISATGYVTTADVPIQTQYVTLSASYLGVSTSYVLKIVNYN